MCPLQSFVQKWSKVVSQSVGEALLGGQLLLSRLSKLKSEFNFLKKHSNFYKHKHNKRVVVWDLKVRHMGKDYLSLLIFKQNSICSNTSRWPTYLPTYLLPTYLPTYLPTQKGFFRIWQLLIDNNTAAMFWCKNYIQHSSLFNQDKQVCGTTH